MLLIFTAVSLSVLTVFFAARPMAARIGLVDLPGGRKHHAFETPLLGGVGIYVGILVGVALSWPPSALLISLVGLSGLLLVLGLVDDALGLSPWVRLVVELFVVSVCFALFPQLVIDSLATPFGIIEFGSVGFIVSVVLVVGILNSFNLIDGIDGLAAVLFLVAFSVVAALTLYQEGQHPLLVLTIMLGLLLFLILNLSRNQARKILLGDSGCLMLSLFLTMLFLERINVSPVSGAAKVDVALLLWATALPVFDMLAVSFGRLKRRVNIFESDRSHIHHLILSRGVTSARALAFLGALSGGFVVLGLIVTQLGLEYSILLFTLVSVLYVSMRERMVEWLFN